MNCLFCKNNSDNSKSVEHIIPESLGNKDHILPVGIVCDSCNQYFAIKVEKPLLEQSYFKNLRHRSGIENKKGRAPIEKGHIIYPVKAEVEVIVKEGMTVLDVQDPHLFNDIISSKKGKFVIPHINEPEENNMILSRFLAKVAVEGLLYKLLKVDGWIDEVMHQEGIEEIKNYARYGAGTKFWPYHQRRIYSEDTWFNNPLEGTSDFKRLHEFTILVTKEQEYYFVIAIAGIEYTINLGGPYIGNYKFWLYINNQKSALDNPNEKKIIKPYYS